MEETFLYKLFKRIGWRAITPETPPEDRAELRERVKGTPELARAQELARIQQARLLQTSVLLARHNQGIEHKAAQGLGEKVASIPAEIFVQVETEHGHGCFRDPAFMKSFLEKNPQFAVRTSRGTRGQQYVRDRMRA